jgi:hypothetical protein
MNIEEFVRPSSMSPIEDCPGRPRMEARALAMVPALAHISRAVAEQGNLAHAVKAQVLALIYHQTGGWTDPAAALAKMAGALSQMQPWAADACRRCVAYVVALVDQMVAAGLRVAVEVEMHLSGRGVGIKRGGTADTILLGFRDNRLACVIIEDTKTGFLDQGDAADHLQLATYAVMGWDKYQPPEPVVIHLAQGRLRDFSAASFDQDAIASVRERIRAAVARALSEKPQLNPCINACRYCKALLFCAPLRERLMDASDRLALLGADPRDRLRLAEDASLCRRFAEDARELAKVWSAEIQSEQAKANEAAPK